MTQIVGFAGKKQSGKNTCCNLLVMLKLLENGVCKSARLDDNGDIEVTDVFGQTVEGKRYFPFKKPGVNVDAVLRDLGKVKVYALADTLKQVAIDVLGLPEDKVYGTDKDKQTKTHLRWENMPGVITPKLADRLWMGSTDPEKHQEIAGQLPLVVHKPGKMTIREVLQFMGTEIFRRMYENVWVDSLFRRIEKDEIDLALVCDVRFENEITGLQKRGAIIVGLERDIFKSKDKHASEQVNLELCNKIVQNSHMDIASQNREVYMALKQAGCKYLPDLGV